jgi:hypothetical protein
MKTKIKKKVQALIDSYTGVKKDIISKIADWKKDTIYSAEHKDERIKELEAEAVQLDMVFNGKMKDVISEEKAALIGEPEAKPADYQVQISNALKFLELAGSKLNDDQAYNILKPFQADYDTMQLFQATIGGIAKNGGVHSTFSKTFEKTNDFMALVNSFEFSEKTAVNLFDFKADGLTAGVKSSMFMDSINQIEQLASKIDAA